MRKTLMTALTLAAGLIGAASAQTTTTSTTTTTTRSMSMPMHRPMMQGQMMHGQMRGNMMNRPVDVYVDHHRYLRNVRPTSGLRVTFPRPGTHTVEVVRLDRHSRSTVLYRRVYHTSRIGQSEYLNLRQLGLR